MFKIGEFSRIAQVQGSQLRYYDEINLFKPAHTDRDSGYRYYTIDQLATLNRILALKDLGLTLEQISKLIHDNISTEEIRGMLTLKKAQVEQNIREEITRLRQIETRLRQVEESGAMPAHDVIIKAVPAQQFIYVYSDTFTGIDFLKLIGQTRLALEASNNNPIGNPTFVTYAEMIEQDMDWEFGYPTAKGNITKLPSPIQNLDVMHKVLPEVQDMATVLYQGTWETGYIGFNALGRWIADHGYEIAGPWREVMHRVPTSYTDELGMIEFQFPVKKRPSALIS